MKTQMVSTIYETAKRLYKKGAFSEAADMFLELIPYYRDLQDYDRVFRLYLYLAHAFTMMGESEKAGEFLARAEGILNSVSPDLLGMFYVVKCGVLVSNGSVEEAKNLLPSILAIKDRISAATLGSFYTNLAAGYIEKKQYEAAIRVTEEALSHLKKGAPKNFTLALNNLGYLYIKVGEPETALVYLKEALKLAEEHGFNDAKAIIYDNLTDIYIDYLEDYQQGYFFSNLAVKLNEESNNRYNLISSLVNLARSLFYLGRYSELKEVLEKIEREKPSPEDLTRLDEKYFTHVHPFLHELKSIEIYPVEEVVEYETLFESLEKYLVSNPGILERTRKKLLEITGTETFQELLIESLNDPDLAVALFMRNRAKINEYIFTSKRDRVPAFKKLRKYLYRELRDVLEEVIADIEPGKRYVKSEKQKKAVLNYILEKIDFPIYL